jgi:alkylation response protein AidB-like acyl-CoA dehydrogenase
MIPSPETLVGRARELAPVLAQRALECEALRRLPDASHAEFRAAGFYKILQPRRYGGYAMDLRVLYEVSRELGRGCASSAWVCSILAIHQWYLAFFDPRAQDDIWGEAPDALACTPFRPAGSVTRMADGIVLRDGRWDFASGCDHAQWALLGVLVPPDGDGPPDYCMAMVPQPDFEIMDTWHVVGLRGTGSKDLAVREAHVPAHRLFSLSQMLATGYAPGLEVNREPEYAQPFFGASVMTLVAPAVGAALGAIDVFAERLGQRVLAFRESRQGEHAPSQARLAQAMGKVDAAELLITRDSAQMKERARSGETASLLERARYRFDNAYATRLCVEAVDLLFDAAGGSALQDSHRLQRAWRDVHAVASHAGLNLDTTAELLARVRLGLPPNDPVI